MLQIVPGFGCGGGRGFRRPLFAAVCRSTHRPSPAFSRRGLPPPRAAQTGRDSGRRPGLVKRSTLARDHRSIPPLGCRDRSSTPHPDGGKPPPLALNFGPLHTVAPMRGKRSLPNRTSPGLLAPTPAAVSFGRAPGSPRQERRSLLASRTSFARFQRTARLGGL